MEKKQIAILFGGMSAEYEVSLHSAYSVIQNIDIEKYTPVLIGITQDGSWFRFRGDTSRLLDDTWQDCRYCTPAYISPSRGNRGLVEHGTDVTIVSELDAAFPVMHGPLGEDGTVQGLLELAGIPIVGCGTLASALCMDKDKAHAIAQARGIPVPASFVYTQDYSFTSIRQDALTIGYPLFVKPVSAGSSCGVSRVESELELAAAVENAFQYDAKIVIEEAIDGFEVGCAVMGSEKLVIGELDEVELAGGFFDFTEKYNLITSKIHVPARIAPEKTRQIKEMARRLYRALGCKGFARIDMFLQPDGKIYFNEANTIPGFTAHSRFPNMMQCAGLAFPELIDKLIETAVAS